MYDEFKFGSDYYIRREEGLCEERRNNEEFRNQELDYLNSTNSNKLFIAKANSNNDTRVFLQRYNSSKDGWFDVFTISSKPVDSGLSLFKFDKACYDISYHLNFHVTPILKLDDENPFKSIGWAYFANSGHITIPVMHMLKYHNSENVWNTFKSITGNDRYNFTINLALAICDGKITMDQVGEAYNTPSDEDIQISECMDNIPYNPEKYPYACECYNNYVANTTDSIINRKLNWIMAKVSQYDYINADGIRMVDKVEMVCKVNRDKTNSNKASKAEIEKAMRPYHKKLIKIANSHRKPNLYTKDSWEAFIDALNNAKSKCKKGTCNEGAINAVIEAERRLKLK